MPRRKKNSRSPVKRQRIAGVTITVQNSHRPGKACKVVMRRNGVRIREEFTATKVEAEGLFEKWTVEVGNSGAVATASISDSDKRSLMEWREKLAPFNKTPADAVAHLLAYLERCKRSMTVMVLSDNLQLLKKREGMGKRYLDDLRNRLKKFCQTFGNRIVADVTSDEISNWLSALDAVAVTKLNYRRILSVVFNYAVTLKACEYSPVDGALKPKVRTKPVGVLTVGEAASLLKAANAYPQILPSVAIALFAGLRDSEIERLRWEDVDLKGRHIALKAEDNKTNTARHVAIRPALAAWLKPHRQLSGWIYPHNKAGKVSETGRNLIDKACYAAGFGKPGTETEKEVEAGLQLKPWPHNALRHSFGTYGLAVVKNAASLALEMGNSPAVLLARYAKRVTPAVAKPYWKLTPQIVLTGTGKIIPSGIKAAAAA